jgi:hypothetical protein
MTVMLSMSSIDFRRLTACVLLSGALSASCAAWQAEPKAQLSCPETITVAESAAPVPGWQSKQTSVTRTFERVSIYNGSATEKEYELAPDDEKQQGKKTAQTWRLTGYRDMNIFLRCRYKGTSAVLFKDIPKSFTTCTFTFQLGADGKINGKSSFACQ